MQPWETIDRTRAPDGTELVLARRGEEWVVRAGGRVLMTSRMHGSEEALAAWAPPRRARWGRCCSAGSASATRCGRCWTGSRSTHGWWWPSCRTGLVGWNRGVVAHLAGRPLDDPRTRLQVGDVAGHIAEANRAFDAILLDVDNGPSSFVHEKNDRLYGSAGWPRPSSRSGRAGCWRCGRPDRTIATSRAWSGPASRRSSQVAPARGAAAAGRHVIFLGVKPGPRRRA